MRLEEVCDCEGVGPISDSVGACERVRSVVESRRSSLSCFPTLRAFLSFFSTRGGTFDIVGFRVYNRFNNSVDVNTSICLSQSFAEFVCARARATYSISQHVPICIFLGLCEMSRISNRIATISAALGIVLLVILLVILWSNVRNVDRIGDVGRMQNDSMLDRFIVDEAREKRIDGVAWITTTLDSIEQNFTNEVLSKETQSTKKHNNASSIDVLRLAKDNLEYVKPFKISQNQYEDPPEEFSTAKRHHSGHFRHASAEVWDPHPQYEFTAFGRRFRLRLAHDASFVSPDLKVTHMSENTTRREHAGHQLGCYYSGSVDGDPSSAVSVSLCHGMTGHVKTSMGSYFIKPTEHWREGDKDSLGSLLQHAIYRVPATASNFNDNSNFQHISENKIESRNCGVIDTYDSDDRPASLTDDTSAHKVYVGTGLRKRRSLMTRETASQDEREYERFAEQTVHRPDFFQKVDYDDSYQNEKYTQDPKMDSNFFVTWRPRRALPREYFIEIMVVADAKMVEYHGSGLISYILVLMSTVSRIYKDQSIGNPVSIAVMKIIQTDEVFGIKHSGSDGIAAAEMLKQFCQWQKHNNPDEPSPEHHDAALLLTRENLCHNPGQKRCDTLGLAELGRMCSPGSSCAIVQDNGLAAAFTIAHEIGHVLNMPHDDDAKCASFRNRSGVHNVMSRMLDDNTFPWEWSKCSRYYVTEFLEAGYANCLLDEPSKMMERQTGRLPGEDYSENKQCELVFGHGSRICPHMVSDVCRRLWCTAPLWDYHQQCHTQHMPWADGTPCGVDKWCHRGECVSRRNLDPVDGQWGEWGRYGECSRTCGGGIKRKYRECDNPAPKNGGNYCIGERVKYRSCGTRECPPGSSDFREQQCSKFDNNNFNIQNLARDVKWHAKYTRILPQDRCKLYCQVESNQYYMLRDKVIDGTPCGPDTFHICVNGQCKPAGCDHVLNSTAELDTCGVCRGDNSTCQRITGSYNASVYGYTKVAKIPAGSSYIDIRQHGWLGSHNDSNYLALRIGEDGEYILNGNFMVMHRKVIVHPGVTIEYSGPESVVERLNSSRPIIIDLILEVLSVGNVYPPQITYEYTVPKRILNSFTWLLSDWSTCNRMCQGMKYRKVICRSTEHKDEVPDDYCKGEQKPQEDSQICNAYCTLQWQMISVSECSNHCGPGVRTVTWRCVQILLDSPPHPPRPVPAHACLHIEKPSEHQSCIGPCDDAHWSYSEWNACSVSCGGGIQLRSAICVDSNERQVRDQNCARQEKHLKKICGQEACPKWDLGEWSPCSVTCGVGKRHRASWCQVENRVVPRTFCSGTPIATTEICAAGPCYHWHTGDWSPCSVTCGEGILRRKVVCQNPDGMTSDECPISEKPETSIACTLKPCLSVVSLPPPIIYSSSNSPREDPSQQDNEIDSNGITFHSDYKWHIGSYGECSRKCNAGYKSRIVKCISSETGIFAPDYYCDSNQQPIDKIACNRHPCPTWNTGDWSECNVGCGHGFQHRQVRCQSHHGETLPDEECTDEQPKYVRRCQKESCKNNSKNSKENNLESNIVRRWKISNWTPCSKSCGTGVQTRRVECTMRRSNHGPEIPVKDEQCSRSKSRKPKSQRLCQRIACDYIWQEGPWSECSVECGEGIQHRTVTCHRVNRYEWVDPTPTEGCPMDQKPAGDQICKLRECSDKYYWITGTWRKCSHPCGRKGRQIRKVYCHDANGKKVARFHCSSEYKPQRKRKCNQRRCGPITCFEIQKRLKTTTDGEYSLLIGGRNMAIYCHGMSSVEPREYLTLPAGDSENYAEIYDKRLKNPHSCPFNGQRNDSCNCVSELGTVSGRTMFKRVRIDPAKLYIIANDYTFSWTKGMKRVEYGKAGDCYSLTDCPQGRFSINLRGTALGLSPTVTWVKETSSAFFAINKINDQRILGKCGGYCGFCKPKTGLKLDVLLA